jgi:hypothetical protein
VKGFERLPEKKSLFDPTKREIFDALDARMRDMDRREREPTVEQSLEYAHALREAILDGLVELGKIRDRHKQARTEDFETLKFMIQQGYLNARGKHDANAFFHVQDTVRDEALSQLAFLRETDEVISGLEGRVGFSEEEIALHAESRKRHVSMWEAELGVS